MNKEKDRLEAQDQITMKKNEYVKLIEDLMICQD